MSGEERGEVAPELANGMASWLAGRNFLAAPFKTKEKQPLPPNSLAEGRPSVELKTEFPTCPLPTALRDFTPTSRISAVSL